MQRSIVTSSEANRDPQPPQARRRSSGSVPGAKIPHVASDDECILISAMRPARTIVTLGLLTAVAGLALALAATASATVTATPVGHFNRPTYVTAAPGANDLLFVVERRGTIQVLQGGVVGAEPFLDIRDIVQAYLEDPGAGGEQGLLSVAFAPDYQSSGRFYAFFINNDGDVEIDEFQVSTDRLRADPTSRREVIVIPHRASQNHNGGLLQFGPGGRSLFFGVGDGGAGQRANARDTGNLLGKLMRIDPRPIRGNPYRIPNQNPLVGQPGRDEIYAYGLRNPWRFSFDRGRLAIGDVGQAQTEEVDFLRTTDAKGANFGWPQYEGNDLFEPTLPGPDPPTFPMHTYSHDGGACAVTGGYVVRDPRLPELFTRYIYADYCTGEIRTLRPVLESDGGFTVRNDFPLGITLPGLSSFGRDNAGRIYVTQFSGDVYRLDPATA